MEPQHEERRLATILAADVVEAWATFNLPVP